jgi:hypothetical protein
MKLSGVDKAATVRPLDVLLTGYATRRVKQGRHRRAPLGVAVDRGVPRPPARRENCLRSALHYAERFALGFDVAAGLVKTGWPARGMAVLLRRTTMLLKCFTLRRKKGQGGGFVLFGFALA